MKTHMKRFLYFAIIGLAFSTQANFSMQKFERKEIDPVKQEELNKKLLEVPISFNSIEIVNDLIQKGADPNIILPINGSTWLHIASQCDEYTELVKCLLQYGASANIKNKEGMTPLYAALIDGAPQNAHLLLQSGASLKDMRAKHEEPALARMLYMAQIDKLTSGSLSPRYFETAKILIGTQEDIINKCNRFINHDHTNAELAYCLKLTELEILFRTKIAEKLFKPMRELRQTNQANYLALLPLELQQEVALFVTNDDYELKGGIKP